MAEAEQIWVVPAQRWIAGALGRLLLGLHQEGVKDTVERLIICWHWMMAKWE